MSNIVHLPQPPEIVAALRAAGCGILRRPMPREGFRDITVALDDVEEIVRRAAPGKQRCYSVQTIRSVVSAVCYISVNELISERRHAPVCRARHIAYFVAREITGQSLPAIGKAFGGRDHSTILHGIQKVEANRAMFEPELSKVLLYLKGRRG